MGSRRSPSPQPLTSAPTRLAPANGTLYRRAQQRLNFRPLPQGHGSLRPTRALIGEVSKPGSVSKSPAPVAMRLLQSPRPLAGEGGG